MLDKLKLKYSKKPLKGDKYNLRNLKLLIDEILLDYMKSNLNLKLNNLYTDFQIAVGLLSTVLAALLTYFSLNYEFHEYKTFLLWSLITYYFFNGIISLCDLVRTTTYQFTGIKENTTQDQSKNGVPSKNEIQIRVCTEITPPSSVYTLMVYRDNKLIPEKWSKSVFDLFDNEGRMKTSEFLDEMNLFFNKG